MTDRVPLHDFARSRAVVMGTSDYAHLPPVPAVLNSLQRMTDLLMGPWCEWPGERLLILENKRDLGVLPDELITAFEDVTDVALFYYVGHGQIDLDDQLCLGLVGSRLEANRRAATGLSFQTVRRALLDSPAATKIVILDCCFAGLASLPANTLSAFPGEVLDMTAGTGAYTLAASGAYTTAWYESDPQVSRPQTYFTRYLADLVEGGIPGEAPLLRLHSMFTRLRDALERDGRPVPRERSVDAARDFVFARNAAPPQTYRDLQQEFRLLAQRLAEAEEREARERAAAEGREQALRAEAARLTQELGRLREQERRSRSLDAVQQRELHDAIRATERRLDETTAAEATAITEPPGIGSAAMPQDIVDPAAMSRSAQREARTSTEHQAPSAIPVVSGDDAIPPGVAQPQDSEQARQQAQEPAGTGLRDEPATASGQEHPSRLKRITKSWVSWAAFAAIVVLGITTSVTLLPSNSALAMGQSVSVTSEQTGDTGAAIVTLSDGQVTTRPIGRQVPANGYYVVVHVKVTATSDGFNLSSSAFYAVVNGRHYDTNSGNDPTLSLPNELNFGTGVINKGQSSSGDIAFDIPSQHGTIAFTPGNAKTPVAYWSF